MQTPLLTCCHYIYKSLIIVKYKPKKVGSLFFSHQKVKDVEFGVSSKNIAFFLFVCFLFAVVQNSSLETLEKHLTSSIVNSTS